LLTAALLAAARFLAATARLASATLLLALALLAFTFLFVTIALLPATPLLASLSGSRRFDGFVRITWCFHSCLSSF
jgi:hypothetical protein